MENNTNLIGLSNEEVLRELGDTFNYAGSVSKYQAELRFLRNDKLTGLNYAVFNDNFVTLEASHAL